MTPDASPVPCIASPPQIELKKKFKYRLMLDETWSFGTLGKMGRGLSEIYNLPVSQAVFVCSYYAWLMRCSWHRRPARLI